MDKISFVDQSTWDLWLEHFGESLRPEEPFENFEDHIDLDFLPAEQYREVMMFLIELYNLCGLSWKPMNCRWIDTIANFGLMVLKSSEYKYIKEIKIKRYLRGHFWIHLVVDGVVEEIIIDPTGVPLDLRNYTEDIQPFFGRFKDAHEHARIVYSRRQEYDGSTSEFPPGFRP